MTKKLLFGLAIAGITVFAVYKYEENKKKYTQVSTPNHPIPENETEASVSEEEVSEETKDEDVSEKVKKSIQKHIEKLLDYISNNVERFEAMKTLLGLAAAAVTFVCSIRKASTINQPSGVNEIEKALEWMFNTNSGEYLHDNRVLVWEVKEATA